MGVWLNKKTGKWQYKFQYQGEVFKQEGYKTRAQAIQAEGNRRSAAENREARILSISFQELSTKYLQYCKAYMQKNTWRQKTFIYRSFLTFAGGNIPARQISTQAIRDFLSIRFQTKGPKAANRSLRDLSALFNWAIEEEIYKESNPCKRIMKFPEDHYQPYIPPVEDVAAVKLAANPDERDFIEVLYHAIGRKSEILKLTWQDVNFERKWIRLWTRKRRGGGLEAQYKPTNETLYGVLQRRWKHRDKNTQSVFTFTAKQASAMMKKLCERAGVKPFGFHAIRHHVLSVINDSGKASMKQIQELAGHKRQSTTETYLHAMGSAVRDAAKLLDKQDQDEDQDEKEEYHVGMRKG